MDDIRKQIFESGMIAPITLTQADAAVNLCRALYAGGVHAVELCCTEDTMEQMIQVISRAIPDLNIGIRAAQEKVVDLALEAGVDFILLDSLNLNAVEKCARHNRLVIPTASTCIEVAAAAAHGLDLCYISSVSPGKLEQLKYDCAAMEFIVKCSKGDNLGELLKNHSVLACITDCMLDDDLVLNERFGELTKLVGHVVREMHEFTFAHMCINPRDESADAIANRLENLFGFSKSVNPDSIFASNGIEITRRHEKGRGTNGHFGVTTASVGRAMAYLRKKGVEFDLSTLQRRENRETFVFLKEEIGGFAVHIVQYL